MGSPLGPLLADIFMGKLESTELKGFLDGCILYKRYVDDIFCVVDEELNMEKLLGDLNSAHANISFSYESESNNQLPFLDVKITRLVDGTQEREVFRKPTWTSQYTHFSSFVPLYQKRNLIRCLVRRSTIICTPNTIQAELCFLRGIFLQNGYPERLIDKTFSSVKFEPRIPSVSKKQVYMSLPFKGDHLTEVISRRLQKTVDTTFKAAKLCMNFNSKPLIRSQLKDKMPSSTTSFCVYSFVCSCGASYIGRTTRRLSDRIREHHPAWLNKGLNRKITSSAILCHLVDFNHTVNINDSFSIIYRIPNYRSRITRFRLLSTAEAVSIRLHNPELCSQKMFVRALHLPWPMVKSSPKQTD